MKGRLLGYPISVVEGVVDEFISVRENLTHRALGQRSDNPVSPGGPRLVDNLGSDISVR